jgi:membrane protein involved in D-alanine export
VGALAALFSVPGLRQLHVLSLLPYSSILFFVGYILLALLIYLFKKPLSRRISYSGLIFTLHVLYFLFLFPKPVHAFLFGAYFYAIYYLYAIYAKKITQPEALLFTLVPMLVARTTGEVQMVGLSYLTFRAFHMIMDAPQLGRLKPREHFSFLLFVPSLLAGPIDRMQNFGAQLKQGFGLLTAEKLAQGYQLILVGAVMKFVLAEVVSRTLLTRGLMGVQYYLAEFYGYSLFLYFDFAGYSAMAIGCGLLLGLRLPDNFNKPYLSQNPQDFWRRFHISLGEWLRDFFFKPIYKLLHSLWLVSSRPLLRQNVAVFLTFFLMGCWNGLKTHYLLSGALFGIYSVVYNSYVFWTKRRGRGVILFGSERATKWLAIFVTVNLCCLALYIFSGRYEH